MFVIFCYPLQRFLTAMSCHNLQLYSCMSSNMPDINLKITAIIQYTPCCLFNDQGNNAPQQLVNWNIIGLFPFLTNEMTFKFSKWVSQLGTKTGVFEPHKKGLQGGFELRNFNGTISVC